MINLLDRISYICPNFDRTLFERFMVHDVVDCSKAKVVLILESPHKDEIKACPHRPLLGRSGRDVTRVLNALVNESHLAKTDEPIGKLINQNNTRFEWLGIMNTCQIPMQNSAYCPDNSGRNTLLKSLKNIRKRKECEEIQDGLERLIVDDLRFRVNKIQFQLNPDIKLVPCGKVARRLSRAAGVNLDQIPRVPHPSRGQWLHVLEILNLVQLIKNLR